MMEKKGRRQSYMRVISPRIRLSRSFMLADKFATLEPDEQEVGYFD